MILHYIIKELEKEQMKEIYHKWMLHHFPADEMKPWENIEWMLEHGAYCGYGLFLPGEQEELAGYTFFSNSPDSKMVLLDYFAIIDEHRSKGIGSHMLAEMRQLLAQQYEGILIETEDILFAKNEAERTERERRDAFYARAGAVQVDLHTEVYGAKYAIWYYPCTEIELTSERKNSCRSNLQAIYKIMIPGEKYEKFVRI